MVVLVTYSQTAPHGRGLRQLQLIRVKKSRQRLAGRILHHRHLVRWVLPSSDPSQLCELAPLVCLAQ